MKDDNDADGVNSVNKFDESDDIEDANRVEEITYADMLDDEAHPPKYYLKLIEDFNDSDFRAEDYRRQYPSA